MIVILTVVMLLLTIGFVLWLSIELSESGWFYTLLDQQYTKHMAVKSWAIVYSLGLVVLLGVVDYKGYRLWPQSNQHAVASKSSLHYHK